MRILYATYASPEDFLKGLHNDGNDTLLAVTTKAAYRDNESTILEIGYPGLPNRILVRARAVPSPKNDDERKWFVINEEEELQLDFLIAIAAGKADASVQRRHRRFPMRMEARVRVDGESDKDSLPAQTADMATGGVALETDAALPDGTKVTVVLDPGDGSGEIQIAGTVMWNREGEFQTAEVGIQFEKGSTEDMKRLRQLIRGVKLSGEYTTKPS